MSPELSLQKFHDIFKNRASNTLSKKKVKLAEPKIMPLVHLQGDRTDAYHQFRLAKKSEVANAVKAELAAQKDRNDRKSAEDSDDTCAEQEYDGSVQNDGEVHEGASKDTDNTKDDANTTVNPRFITEFSSKLSTMWRALSEEEREKWKKSESKFDGDQQVIFG